MSFDKIDGDPYGKGSAHSISRALEIRLVWERLKRSPFNKVEGYITFYQFETCVEFVLKYGLKICNITNSLGVIIINAEASKYILRRVLSEEYDKVYDFIFKSDKEFRPKMSWKNKKLSAMCRDGLKNGKWLAYAYFDEKKEIVAYLDYKIRVDGDIELGAALTRAEDRKKGLASSLIWFFKLMFPMFGFHAGTFEENTAMIKTFLKVGFRPRYFWNEETGERTNKIKERINWESTGEAGSIRLTDSVYYCSEGVLKESLKTARRV